MNPVQWARCLDDELGKQNGKNGRGKKNDGHAFEWKIVHLGSPWFHPFMNTVVPQSV